MLISIVQEEDWRARESAILALGAISEGCANGLLSHLSEMVAIMLPMLLDARPLVRSISCWALSRYSYWVVQASVELNSQGKQQFDTVVAVRQPFPWCLHVCWNWVESGGLRCFYSKLSCSLASDVPQESPADVSGQLHPDSSIGTSLNWKSGCLQNGSGVLAAGRMWHGDPI